MENPLSKSVLSGLFILTAFWFSFSYLSKDVGVMDVEPVKKETRPPSPVIKYEIVGPPVVKEIRVPTPKKVEPPKPVTWWTVARVTEFHENGVTSIPIGSRVSVIHNADGTVTISDGKNRLTTKAENITSDPVELNKLNIKKRP